MATQRNFSQFPGFRAHFEQNPRRTEAASAADQELLERHRPRFYLPPGHPGPVSFYDDYVAEGTLADTSGTPISDAVTRDILNTHKTDAGAVFTHKPSRRGGTPVVFGRVDRDTLTRAGGTEVPLIFLSYHLVFRHSGIPAGLPRWQQTILDRVASLEDWHQLDHYTAVYLVLTPDRHPVALMFQQHNYLRSYVIGRDLTLPDDGRPQVDVAIGSNELYPHRPDRTRRRAAPFLSAGTVEYLLAGRRPPRFQTDDITHGVDEVAYRLDYLPHDDAFYMFHGWLGARRRLPGRDGPPGADYNTLPAFKPPVLQLLAFYWHEDHTDYVDLVKDGLFHGADGRFRRQIDGGLYERLVERFPRFYSE